MLLVLILLWARAFSNGTSQYWVKYTSYFWQILSVTQLPCVTGCQWDWKSGLILPLLRTIVIWIWFAHFWEDSQSSSLVRLSWQWAPLVPFSACSPIIMMMSLFPLLLSLLLLLSGDLCPGVELPVADGSILYWTALCYTISLPFWVYIETCCSSNKGSLVTICQCTW